MHPCAQKLILSVHIHAVQGFQDVFSTQIQVPPLPPKAQFTPTPAQPAASGMPGSAADLEASLGYTERQRVTREREDAAELEKKAQAVRHEGNAGLRVTTRGHRGSHAVEQTACWLFYPCRLQRCMGPQWHLSRVLTARVRTLTCSIHVSLRQQAQTQLEAARAAQAYFQRALQELTLFKSKTSAALLQVSPYVPHGLLVMTHVGVMLSCHAGDRCLLDEVHRRYGWVAVGLLLYDQDDPADPSFIGAACSRLRSGQRGKNGRRRKRSRGMRQPTARRRPSTRGPARCWRASRYNLYELRYNV